MDQIQMDRILQLIRRAHNGYNPGMRELCPELKEPASEYEALEDIISESELMQSMELSDAYKAIADLEEQIYKMSTPDSESVAELMQSIYECRIPDLFHHGRPVYGIPHFMLDQVVALMNKATKQ